MVVVGAICGMNPTILESKLINVLAAHTDNANMPNKNFKVKHNIEQQ